MKKKSILSIISGLFLSGCGLATWVFYGMIAGDIDYTDFPLGQNRQIEILINNKVYAPYAIALRTEYKNAKKINQNRSDWYIETTKYPYNFTIVGYKLKNGKEEQILQETFTNNRQRFQSFGSDTEDIENYAFVRHIFHMKLPIGKYRFIVKDNSVYTSEYKQMNTSIGIHIYQHK